MHRRGKDLDPGDEAPLRAELITANQMEQHGKHLAVLHESALTRAQDQFPLRLADNERTLLGLCTSLAQSDGPQRRMTPAGKWLLDNLYLIEEEVRIARRHLPPGYSREIPRLRTGPSAERPQAYDLAIECVAHGEGRLARGSLTSFIASYQTVRPLLLGELWAIPIMLRLALIENLRCIEVQVAGSRSARHLAAEWAERMVEVAEKEPKRLTLVVADMARSDPPMTAPP